MNLKSNLKTISIDKAETSRCT